MKHWIGFMHGFVLAGLIAGVIWIDHSSPALIVPLIGVGLATIIVFICSVIAEYEEK